MRRGKVQLKPIEDKHRRQVTFSKRRNGLMKKARELAVLCEADVALVVFSSRGRVYDFCSGDSIIELLERYKIHVEKEAVVCKRATQMKDDCQSSSLNTNQLQAIQRIDMIDIDKLNMIELTQLEKQQDALLRQIAYKKSQKAMETINAFRDEGEQLRKEKRLMEEQIREKMKECNHRCGIGGAAPPQPAVLQFI